MIKKLFILTCLFTCLSPSWVMAGESGNVTGEEGMISAISQEGIDVAGMHHSPLEVTVSDDVLQKEAGGEFSAPLPLGSIEKIERVASRIRLWDEGVRMDKYNAGCSTEGGQVPNAILFLADSRWLNRIFSMPGLAGR